MKNLLPGFCILALLLSCNQENTKRIPDFPKKHVVFEASNLKGEGSRSLGAKLFEVKKLHKDRLYANHTEKKAGQLTYDLFVPQNEQSNRPMIVFLHPGAFITGSKEDNLTQQLAHDFAAKGYVTLAANYRLAHYAGDVDNLLGQLLNPRKIAKAQVYRSLQDVHSLLAYSTAQAESWGADPNQIYLAGYSAGAILALNYTYVDEREAFDYFDHSPSDCLDCLPYAGETEEASSTGKIQGVMAIAGGLFDLNHIQAGDKVPTLLIHGTQDDMVPFTHGIPFNKYKKAYDISLGDMEVNISKELSESLINIVSLPVYGSREIYEKLTRNAQLIEWKGKNHSFRSSGTEYSLLLREMEKFLGEFE